MQFSKYGALNLSSKERLFTKEARVAEIEAILTDFKQRKQLLLELEKQARLFVAQGRDANLILSKVQSLRVELRAEQPSLKPLLTEIAMLK